MNTLKLKIFEVLDNTISIEKFENWLYNSKFLQEDLKENSLVFEVVNINYRKVDAINILKEIAATIFDAEDFLIMKIEENCKKIINAKTTENIESYVFNMVQNHNFDFDSNVYWDFYNFYFSFNGYDYTNYTKGSLEKLNVSVIAYAKTVIESLKNCESVEEKKHVLLSKKEAVKPQLKIKKEIAEEKKESIKTKIFAFFKKI